MDDYESALSGWLPGRQNGSSAPAAPAEDDEPLLGAPRKGPQHFAALERVKEWTRARFKLPEDAGIMVAEVVCQLPGCPPLETAVAFWTADGTRYHFKLMKPVEEVTEDNLPYSWMMESLIQPEGFGCECC
jgi:hypothetical protein